MLTFVGCVLLSGCAPHSSALKVTLDEEALQSGNLAIPDFTGPYKDDLIKYYQDVKSEFFRKVIADQWVSDEEFREAQERARICLEDAGFTGVEYFAQGGSTFANRSDLGQSEMLDLHEECEVSTGFAATEIWYGMLRRNPDNVDWPTAERDCLVKVGLLPEGTTVEEMNQWYSSQAPESRSQLAYQCSHDALGYLGDKKKGD